MFNIKKFSVLACVAGSLLAGVAHAADRKETVGVDGHYKSTNGYEEWTANLSYARLFADNLEAAFQYSVDGANQGGKTVQGIQAFARQWIGPYLRTDAVVPFGEVGYGLKFSDGKYENVLTAGVGAGIFVSAQSELRGTVRRNWGGFADDTRLDIGYYYHF